MSPTNHKRYTIIVSDELYEKIEDIRFENRIETKSEVTAKLLQIGLAEIEKHPELVEEYLKKKK